MSSPSPTSRSRRAAAALAALVVVLPGAAARGGSEVVPLPITAVLARAGETTLVVDVSAAPAASRGSVAVNVDGAPRPARLRPVVSGALAVSLVVDASADGAAALPGWLSAGARFSLAAPARTRTVVIADRAPAAVVAGPVRGPAGVVRALDTVRAGGERDTAAALTLATGQFADSPAGERVVLLYTTAGRVSGFSAGRLADRFRAAGILLVVVGTTDPDRYWSTAATATGGFFAPAGDPVVVPALDQVETALSSRCLVRFGSPERPGARVSVSVRSGDLVLAGETVLGEPPRDGSRRWWVLGAVAAVVAAAALIFLLVRRRRARAARLVAASPYAVLLGGPPLPPAVSPPTPGVEPPLGPPAAGTMRPAARGRAPVPEPPDE
ncbi:hypothetical protein BJY16_003510 [Actinoplanes octamycinicus]|uniref:VWFA domain-containing protein n=1 Tax=Actinoplanes octamycinicus TaxID=135948 RepID=A0A7W7GXD6_9ACTN|nr:hypothetical protein [Actinoplanes octamycinicus]MBB4740051.1 hypothetical protein [Actinoplanes octamycinicus]GIE59446.1 hypothetical protein Aoc01nite_48480 [Actinoplanes octamycinicus]